MAQNGAGAKPFRTGPEFSRRSVALPHLRRHPRPGSILARPAVAAALTGRIMTELLTERLRLRQFTAADFEPLAAMNADAETMRYLGSGQILERWQSWSSLAGILGHWQLRGYGMFCVEERATGRFAGRVGVLDPEGWPGFEIGWTIVRPLCGRGYATEAARAVRDWAFGTLDRDHAVHLIYPANLASQAVARKLGAAIDRQIPFLGADLDVWRTDRSR